MSQIGSFRGGVNLQRLLPTELWEAIFDDEELLSDPASSTISVAKGKCGKFAFLNNGAFGRAYDRVRDLAILLRNFADSNPDVFYDQVCLDLVNHSSQIVAEFFCTQNVLLVPNCSIGLKSVLESLVRSHATDSKKLVAAYLSPVYGATQKLLQCFKCEGHLDDVIAVAAGGDQNALIEENPKLIIDALTKSFAERQFDVLFVDETASQSGRMAPLNEISTFCRQNKIILIVDGTQSCQLLFDKNKKEILDEIDYFVLSTHKWLCNIKTCGIIRFKNGAVPPVPPAISFGWNSPSHDRIPLSVDEAKNQFQWIGMLDSYISYITLGKAIQIFTKHGEIQAQKSSALLSHGLRNILKVCPMLTDDKIRVMNSFILESHQLEPLADVTRIQNALQDYGVFVSAKKFGRDCGSNNNAIMTCSRKEKFYLRVSAWSFNNEEDFESLSFVLSNNLRLSSASKEAFKHQFTYIFDLYDKLFSVLHPKAFFIRAERLRHHLIFYFGHTAVFYVNKLIVSGKIQTRIDPRLEASLSVGVDEMSWDDLLEDNYDWSKLSESGKFDYLEKVRNYRQKVRHLVLDLIDQNHPKYPIDKNSLHWILLMGIEHEKIHLETSAAIIAQVPVELIKSCHDFNLPTYWNKNQGKMVAQTPEDAPKNQLLPVSGGQVLLGKDYQEQDIYGWDNEYGHEERDLVEFEASQMLVSNAEYLEFVEAGGYTEAGRHWWSREGWKYVTDLGVTGPRFWIGRTHYRMMLEEVPMPWDFPVEVNNLEAEAFCNWKSEKLGKDVRLISHEESVHMRKMAVDESANLNLNNYASPTPVNLHGGKVNGNTFYDISGNVWRHSVSVLTVMDGFRIDPFYDDFTLPTVDGNHNHVLGGSWISLGNCANVNARYGFRRHFYQFAGIRYVASNNDYHKKVPKLFDGILLGKYITEHYGELNADEIPSLELELTPNWPKELGVQASKLINAYQEPGQNLKVLVVHGSVGRTTLEILRHGHNLTIDHTDRTANHLQVLEALLNDSKIQWYQQLEGSITEAKEYILARQENNDQLLVKKNNSINFWQADYKNMRSFLTGYDVVVADFRYKNCADQLHHLLQRLRTGGLLILSSLDDVDIMSVDPDYGIQALQDNFCRIIDHGFSKPNRFSYIQRKTLNSFELAISNLSVWKKTAEPRGLNLDEQQDVTENEIISKDVDQNNNKKDLNLEHFHYQEGLFGIKNFPQTMAGVCINACRKYNVSTKAALELGCGPGRTALELAPFFNHIEAMDISLNHINALKKRLTDANVSNVYPIVGDCNHQTDLCHRKQFDLIHSSNLIDLLHEPKKWIQQSKAMLKNGGLLIVASSYNWSEEFTPKENWIGGYKKNGENFSTTDGLRELLEPQCELLEIIRIPYVIQNEDGTFQVDVCQCTIFGSQLPSINKLHSESQG